MINVIIGCCSEQALTQIGWTNRLALMVVVAANSCGDIQDSVIGNGLSKTKQSFSQVSLSCSSMNHKSQIDRQRSFSCTEMVCASTFRPSMNGDVVLEQLGNTKSSL